MESVLCTVSAERNPVPVTPLPNSLYLLPLAPAPSRERVHAEKSLRLRHAKRPRWQGRVQCEHPVLLETKHEVCSEVEERLRRDRRTRERRKENTIGEEEKRRMSAP